MDAAIQRYNKDTKALEQPLSYKVRRLLDLGCIKKLASGVYIVFQSRDTTGLRTPSGKISQN